MRLRVHFPQPGRPKDRNELKKHQTDYCTKMGYDPVTGRPTTDRLNELGLGFVGERMTTVFGAPQPQAAAPAE